MDMDSRSRVVLHIMLPEAYGNVSPALLRYSGTYSQMDSTYAGQESALWTIAQSNFLAVRDDVPDETVYHIAKAIFENLSALKDMDATMEDVTLAYVTEGLPVPFHPGAERYFQEVGLLPPSRATPSREDDLLRRAPL